MVTASQRLQNTCKVFAGTDTLLTYRVRGDAQSRCKHFTSGSPDRSGHSSPTVGAPMLGRSPLADIVPSKQTPTHDLWIRKLPPRPSAAHCPPTPSAALGHSPRRSEIGRAHV